MSSKSGVSVPCICGQMALEAVGAPILSAVCYCESCRLAARQFEHLPDAPCVLNSDNGVDYCLFRKDRVTIVRGGEHLQVHRVTNGSTTRRVLAGCCNTPMFLDFTSGHWLTLYRDRFPKDAPPLEMSVMAKDLPAGQPRPGRLPIYSTHPPRFMIRLLAAWAAMGFQRPKMVW